jgi:hypothetical protein
MMLNRPIPTGTVLAQLVVFDPELAEGSKKKVQKI